MPARWVGSGGRRGSMGPYIIGVGAGESYRRGSSRIRNPSPRSVGTRSGTAPGRPLNSRPLLGELIQIGFTSRYLVGGITTGTSATTLLVSRIASAGRRPARTGLDPGNLGSQISAIVPVGPEGPASCPRAASAVVRFAARSPCRITGPALESASATMRRGSSGRRLQAHAAQATRCNRTSARAIRVELKALAVRPARPRGPSSACCSATARPRPGAK